MTSTATGDDAPSRLVDAVLTLADDDDNLVDEAKYLVLAALESDQLLVDALAGEYVPPRPPPEPDSTPEPVGAFLASITWPVSAGSVRNGRWTCTRPRGSRSSPGATALTSQPSQKRWRSRSPAPGLRAAAAVLTDQTDVAATRAARRIDCSGRPSNCTTSTARTSRARSAARGTLTRRWRETVGAELDDAADETRRLTDARRELSVRRRAADQLVAAVGALRREAERAGRTVRTPGPRSPPSSRHGSASRSRLTRPNPSRSCWARHAIGSASAPNSCATSSSRPSSPRPGASGPHCARRATSTSPASRCPHPSGRDRGGG